MIVPALENRIMRAVEFDTNGGCWLWTGAIDKESGYGQSSANGRVERAHRASFICFKGSIPKGFYVCHRCDVRCCVNPAHLVAARPAANSADMRSKHRNGAMIGDRNPAAKINNQIRDEILARLASGERGRSIARSFEISEATVSLIKHGKIWNGGESTRRHAKPRPSGDALGSGAMSMIG